MTLYKIFWFCFTKIIDENIDDNDDNLWTDVMAYYD